MMLKTKMKLAAAALCSVLTIAAGCSADQPVKFDGQPYDLQIVDVEQISHERIVILWVRLDDKNTNHETEFDCGAPLVEDSDFYECAEFATQTLEDAASVGKMYKTVNLIIK